MIATIDPKLSSRSIGKRQTWQWPLIIIGILSAHVGLMGLATAITLQHPGESAIIPNYYDKAEAWDAYKQQLVAADKLGWKTTIRPETASASVHRQMRLTLTDAQGKPIAGAKLSVRCFHLSHGEEAVTLQPVQVAPGSFLLMLPSNRTGFWRFELTASAGKDSFVETVTQHLD